MSCDVIPRTGSIFGKHLSRSIDSEEFLASSTVSLLSLANLGEGKIIGSLSFAVTFPGFKCQLGHFLDGLSGVSYFHFFVLPLCFLISKIGTILVVSCRVLVKIRQDNLSSVPGI